MAFAAAALTAQAQNWADSVAVYTERARWGNLSAIESLAECYHAGHGVERNLLNVMFFYEQARDFGGKEADEYFAMMDEDDEMRLVHEASEDSDNKRRRPFERKLAKLREMGSPSVATLEALRDGALSRADDAALEQFRNAANNGCMLAKMLSLLILDVSHSREAFAAEMWELAESVPMAYNTLGFLYFGADYDGKEIVDLDKALHCFRKADERGILSRANARRLLRYYLREQEKGRTPCDSSEMERLKKIALPDWAVD